MKSVMTKTSINVGEFLNQLSDSQLPKTASFSCISKFTAGAICQQIYMKVKLEFLNFPENEPKIA